MSDIAFIELNITYTPAYYKLKYSDNWSRRGLVGSVLAY